LAWPERRRIQEESVQKTKAVFNKIAGRAGGEDAAKAGGASISIFRPQVAGGQEPCYPALRPPPGYHNFKAAYYSRRLFTWILN
jgi:hypothetical protein